MKSRLILLIIAFAFPLTARGEDDQKAVLQNLFKMLDTAYQIERYELINEKLPTASTPADLARELGYTGLENYLVDPWGTPYRISSDPARKSYLIVSAGSDRQFDSSSWSRQEELSDSRRDTVVRDGQIVRSAMRWAQRATGSEVAALADALAWSKAQRTIADIRTLATSVEAYETDHSQYPPTNDLDALEKAVSPTYIKRMPRIDGWGTPFNYASDGRNYRIVSAGADQKFDRQSWNTKASTSDLNQDLVFAQGEFVRQWTADPAADLHQSWGSVFVALTKLSGLRNLSPAQRRAERVKLFLEESDRLYERQRLDEGDLTRSVRLFAKAIDIDPLAVGRDRLLRYAGYFQRSVELAPPPPPPPPGRERPPIPPPFYETVAGKAFGRLLLPHLQRHVAEHTTDTEAVLALVDLTDAVESPEGAIQLLEAELRQRPGNATVWLRLADRRLARNENQKALEALEKAVGQRQISADQLRYASFFFEKVGKQHRALDITRRAAETNPEKTEGWNVLGITAYDLARKQTSSDEEKRKLLFEGEGALRKALTLDPENFESMAYLNLILRQRALLESDPKAQQKLIDEADRLRTRAIEISRKRRPS